jgi:hypothetical protein
MTGLDVRSITDHSLLYCELHISPSLSSLDTSLASKTEFIKYDVKVVFAVVTKLSTELLKRLITSYFTCFPYLFCIAHIINQIS